MSDLNERAKRGQALNLAVADALHNKKEEDKSYILTKYIKYYEISEIIQTYSIEELKVALD